jgi:hypothetical protein
MTRAGAPIRIPLADVDQARALVRELDAVCKLRGFSFAVTPEGHLEVTRSDQGCTAAFTDAVVVVRPAVQEITE